MVWGVGVAVIEAVGLRKEFRNSVVAIDNLDFSIPSGGVYGFLGPNGSGKTTTIRCMLGLIKPSAGSVRLLGEDSSKSLRSVIHRVGALVETPKFFPTFGGRKNLRMFAQVAGLPNSEVDRVLEIVGLGERGGDSFGSYSLGMKQRLAIAATLLKDPEVIILDEPANGLDPAGIVEIRQLIRQLGESGKTIFVSSHQLGEVQQTCDHVMIISKGRLIQSGSVEELVALGQGDSQIITIDRPHEAADILNAQGYQATVIDAATVTVAVDGSEAQAINETLAANQLFLRGLRAQESSLESVFLELTEGEGSL